MLIKKADDKSAILVELEALAKSAGSGKRREIEEELRTLRAGLKGERDAAYLIDFEYGKSPEMAVIHDLRLDIDGRVAQIDHLLIHRSLNCFVLETKHVRSGVKITETGEFLRWNDWKKTYEGMASPLAQNERHISVLRDAFEGLLLPQRAGVALAPVFHSYVLVSPYVRIDRPANFDTSRVIKMDLLRSGIEQDLNRASVPASSASGDSLVSSGTLENLARQLAARHRPAAFDYKGKFGLSGDGDAEPSSTAESWGSGGKEAPHSFEFPPGWPKRQWEKNRKSPTTGEGDRTGYVVALVSVLVILGVISGISRKDSGSENRVAPPATAAVRTPAYAPPPTVAPMRLRSDPPVSERQAPSVQTPPPEPAAPAMRLNDHSLTVTGKGGTPMAEIHGNLPKIRQEMRQSGLGTNRANPTYGIDEPITQCEPKPVMTDEEIAACRRNAGRP
jgi:hypothetical protein